MSDYREGCYMATRELQSVFAQPVRLRQTMIVPISICHALLAIARAVDLAHLARLDSPHTSCSTCQALRSLDEVYPKWRSERAKPKVRPLASSAPTPA